MLQHKPVSQETQTLELQMRHNRLLPRGLPGDDLEIIHSEKFTVPVGAEVEADLAVDIQGVEEVTALLRVLQEDEVHHDQAVHLLRRLDQV